MKKLTGNAKRSYRSHSSNFEVSHSSLSKPKVQDRFVEALQKEELSAREVVEAYRWKALQVQQSYNCVSEFVREASQIAHKLDEDWKGKRKPSLFGLPFSVKDNFHVDFQSASL